MCGIVGFSWADKKLISKMNRVISHRGPDGSGTYVNKGISLGQRRLSIIDLSKNGKQPMTNEDGTIWITFNGEIYNYKEIRKDLLQKGHNFNSETDTEVIIHGYEEYGEQICSKLDGMFAFAIWDSKKEIIFMARDRFGKKPLYYHIDKKNKKIIFASELKSILIHDIPQEINQQAISEFLEMRFIPGNKTIFSEIYKLEPSYYSIWDKYGKFTKTRYWTIPSNKEKNETPSLSKIDSLLHDSVKKRLISDVPIGILLSGGLDSSTITEYMSEVTDKIKTFSVAFEDGGINESKYSRIVSDYFSTDHTEISVKQDLLTFLPKVVWHLDEPLADPAALPTYVLSERVSKKVKVALAGEGGDEVFGGYDSFNSIPFIQKTTIIPSKIGKYVASPILRTLSKFKGYPTKQILQLGAEIIESNGVKERYEKVYYSPFNNQEVSSITQKNYSGIMTKYIRSDESLFQATSNYYFKELLPNYLLMKVDKMSMASGLEVRAPFLDTNLVTYMDKISPTLKLKKRLLRSVMYNKLPSIILNRKKQGFSLPLSDWMQKKEFFSRVEPLLASLNKREIFNKPFLDKLISSPKIYKNDHKIWSLINLELWYQLYQDKIKYQSIKI